MTLTASWNAVNGRGAAITLALTVALSLPATGSAEPPAAIDMYREAVPTSRGSVVSDPGGESFGPLARDVEQKLRSAGPDGEELVRVARSSLFGAPRQTARGHRDDTTAAARTGTGEEAAPLADVVRTPRGVLLLALLCVLTATAVAIRVRHSRASVVDGAHVPSSIVSPRPDSPVSARARLD